MSRITHTVIQSLLVERILNDIFNRTLSQWRIVCLRYFNPVGAHQSGFIGENPVGKANNIYPQITRVAIGKQSKIEIFGSDWPTNDGTVLEIIFMSWI